MPRRSLARHWEILARRDPLRAALTDRERSVEEFFRSGEEELRSVLNQAEALGITIDRSRALDFGCGVGRLTQAMARDFARCDGVDIAASMIASARRYNQYGDTCHYHLNRSADLRLFQDRSFTLIYSVLVLQHMEPVRAKEYLREFLRLLVPGGLLVFQLPSHRTLQEPPAGVRRTLSDRPLPAGARRAQVTTNASAVTLQARHLLRLEVTVRNDSDCRWPSLGRPDERYQIQVADRWRLEDGSIWKNDDVRCPLPYDLEPGAEATVLLDATAPDVDGIYLLDVDVVQEDVLWFGDRGSIPARVRVVVEGGLPARAKPPAEPRAAPPPPRAVRPPARVRHPRLFLVFKATGLRAAYWTVRRMIDLANRMIDAARDHADFVPTAWRRWRSHHRPHMDMYCVPQDEVAALIRECGGTLVDTEKELWPGGFQSYRYWVVRGQN